MIDGWRPDEATPARRAATEVRDLSGAHPGHGERFPLRPLLSLAGNAHDRCGSRYLCSAVVPPPVGERHAVVVAWLEPLLCRRQESASSHTRAPLRSLGIAAGAAEAWRPRCHLSRRAPRFARVRPLGLGVLVRHWSAAAVAGWYYGRPVGSRDNPWCNAVRGSPCA